MGTNGRFARLALVVSTLLLGPGLSAAGATVSSGACCLPAGQCQAVTQFDCETLGGTFIGVDTSCVMIECPAAPIGAPLLSLVGVAAAVTALAGLGGYRLMRRRRR